MVAPPKKVGVVGHPIGQSLSPEIHGTWMVAAGIDGTYVKIDGGVRGFDATVRSCIDAGFLGLNVTVPYKRDALRMADTVSARAARIGAANLLMFQNGTISAENTDCDGFRLALEGSGWAGPRQTARILGAGGAAPAIVEALHMLGFTEVEITNRTEAKCNELIDRFDNVSIVPWDGRDQNLSGVDLLVNTTSLGMKGSPALSFDVTGLPAHAGVIDIVTTPLATPLVRDARAAGLFAQNGLPMLVYQAVPSFEAWFGVSPENPSHMIAELLALVAEPKPKLIGLTGGIGMGKSATAQMFADAGIPVWDADAAVHRLYEALQPGAVAIQNLWPDALAPDGSVDRRRLAAILSDEPDGWTRLNAAIHPLVAHDRQRFVQTAWEEGRRAVLLDIPLLFETGADAQVDVTVLCSAPEDIRRARVLARPNMSEEKYDTIISQQMSDAYKRRKSHFIVETNKGFDAARAQVADILASIFPGESLEEIE